MYAHIRVLGEVPLYLCQHPGVHGACTQRQLRVDGLLNLNYSGRLLVAYNSWKGAWHHVEHVDLVEAETDCLCDHGNLCT